MLTRSPTHTGAAPQRGAAAIEFALLFVIFFGVFYALVSYVFVTLLQQGLVQASAEGVRAGMVINAVNYSSTSTFQSDVTTVATAAVRKSVSWMPANWQATVNANTQVTFSQVNVPLASGAILTKQNITVTVTYPDYAKNPMLPALTLPGLATIPSVPQNLVGRSTAF